jgi:hypothetical protein
VVLICAILFAGAISAVLTLWNSDIVNGSLGFTLDDPWIHLQFARNLHEYGSFSYYKNEMSTSGSTSPLYTVLLSIGMFFTGEEMLLSYTLGVLFHLLGAILFFRFASLLFPNDPWLAVAGSFLFVFEPRLQWVSLSGMETTLCVTLLLATMFFYRDRRFALAAVSGGFLLWTRPEAVILFGALLADFLYHARVAVHRLPDGPVKGALRPRTLISPALILGGLAMAYVAFNFVLSGTIFPNTLAAKLRYYASGGEGFLLKVLTFAGGEHLAVFVILILAGLVSIIGNVLKRKYEPLLGGFLWCVGLVTAYSIYLPYLFSRGRYLMPIIPFVLLIGLRGLNMLSHLFEEKAKMGVGRVKVAKVLVLVMVCVQFGFASWKTSVAYAGDCRYISDRQVRTALWIRDHLPEDAVIATHDIGAIGYYSRRRVLDMVGLVSPEMIHQIGDLTKLREQLILRGATHVAVLRSWFEIDNQQPLFKTDERYPEVMEVFAFDRRQIHFVPGAVQQMRNNSWNLMRTGSFAQAEALMRDAIRADPLSSRSRHAMGMLFLMVGRLQQSENEIRLAGMLNPFSPEIRLAVADIAVKKGSPQDAISVLENLVLEKPDYAPAYLALSKIHGNVGIDTSRARDYLRRYQELAGDIQ